LYVDTTLKVHRKFNTLVKTAFTFTDDAGFVAALNKACVYLSMTICFRGQMCPFSQKSTGFSWLCGWYVCILFQHNIKLFSTDITATTSGDQNIQHFIVAASELSKTKEGPIIEKVETQNVFFLFSSNGQGQVPEILDIRKILEVHSVTLYCFIMDKAPWTSFFSKTTVDQLKEIYSNTFTNGSFPELTKKYVPTLLKEEIYAIN